LSNDVRGGRQFGTVGGKNRKSLKGRSKKKQPTNSGGLNVLRP